MIASSGRVIEDAFSGTKPSRMAIKNGIGVQLDTVKKEL